LGITIVGTFELPLIQKLIKIELQNRRTDEAFVSWSLDLGVIILPLIRFSIVIVTSQDSLHHHPHYVHHHDHHHHHSWKVPIAKIVTKRFESTGLITARA
jgi:hypothetical protein